MSNIKKAVALTSAFISLPKAEYLLSFMMLTGLLFGVFVSLLFQQTFGIDAIFVGALQGLFLLAIPALLTSTIIKLMIRRIPFRRILAASILGQLIYALAYFAYLLLEHTAVPNKEVLIFLAASLSFVIWYVVARFVFVLKWRAFLFAALQTVIYGVFLLTGSLIIVSGDPVSIIVKFFAASAVFMGFVYLFFMIINAPMKRNFGLNTLDAVSLFLSHWFYESKGIEGEFERVGEEAETLLAGFLFKRKRGTFAFLVPYIHFGPFGTLGGSNFSAEIADGIKGRFGMDSFVFHGTVTHDLNPVASSEIDKVLDTFGSGLNESKFAKTPVAFSRAASGDCFCESLVFGDAALASVSRAPNTTEDINFGLGLAMMGEGEKSVPLVAAVDQHNAETGDITSFEPGSPIGFEYISAVAAALSKKPKGAALKVGYSMAKGGAGQIGGAGIKVAVFSSKPEYAMVLIDSNGVSPEMRERIISESKKAAAEKGHELEVGVFTTDTHMMNRVSGVLNPLGEGDRTIDAIRGCVLEAVDSMEPAEFAAFKKRFRINVLGARQSIEIISTVNAIVAVAKIAAPLLIIGSIISILWIVSRI